MFYELHVGTFTREGTFARRGRAPRPPRRPRRHRRGADAGADFPGRCGWGYDGVLSSPRTRPTAAPTTSRRFVDACARARPRRARSTSSTTISARTATTSRASRRTSPPAPPHAVGRGLNFDGPARAVVRAVLPRTTRSTGSRSSTLDGLRLDAVHAIHDDSPRRTSWTSSAAARRRRAARAAPCTSSLENDSNAARLLDRARAPAHAPRAVERRRPPRAARAAHRRARRLLRGLPPPRAAPRALPHRGLRLPGRLVGVPRAARAVSGAADLPPTAFVDFLQNHDQIGNRAFGERITALAPAAARARGHRGAAPRAGHAAPVHGPGVGRARAVPVLQRPRPRPGARRSRGSAARVRRASRGSPTGRARAHPRPPGRGDRDRSVLDWTRIRPAGPPAHTSTLYRTLLALRRSDIVPLVVGDPRPRARAVAIGASAMEAEWVFEGRRTLRLVANLGADARPARRAGAGWGRRLHATGLDREGIVWPAAVDAAVLRAPRRRARDAAGPTPGGSVDAPAAVSARRAAPRSGELRGQRPV